MATVTRYDIIEIGAQIDPETGWIRDRPVITRSGIFVYKDKTGKAIREYRPPDEVFKVDSLVTLAGIPITDGHQGMITAQNVKGILGTVVGPGVKDNTNVVAPIIIHDPNKLGDRKELSLGYRADVYETPGKTPEGEDYDTIQKNVRYNHLAIVTKGRAGNARIRLDGADASSFDIDNEDPDDKKIVNIKLDEIDYAVAQDVARAIAKLMDEHRDRRTKYMALEQERNSLRGQVAEAARILQAAVLDAKNQMRDRIKLEDLATKHKVHYDENTTDRELREGIVTKLNGGSIKFDDKSDDYVQSAFDLAIHNVDDKNNKFANQRQQMNKPPSNNGGAKPMGSVAARQRMIEGMRARSA